jgi:hypothetical protein
VDSGTGITDPFQLDLKELCPIVAGIIMSGEALMHPFFRNVIDIFRSKEPETITIKIPTDHYDPERYCEITYLAKNEAARNRAESLPEKYMDFPDSKRSILPQDTLLKIEKELNLYRHAAGNTPAVVYHTACFGGTDMCEHWDHGYRSEIFGIHAYTVTGNHLVEPADPDNPHYFLTDKKRIESFACQYWKMKSSEADTATATPQPV